MTLANHYYRPSGILTACCLLVLSGCAHQALNDQLATSQEAIKQAQTAGAPETAPADFAAANDKLDRAKSAESHRDMVVAMRLAEQAQADANLANAKTESTRATTAATEIVKGNQALSDEISRSKKLQQR